VRVSLYLKTKENRFFFSTSIDPTVFVDELADIWDAYFFLELNSIRYDVKIVRVKSIHFEFFSNKND
jgi:hypothetical protein